MKSPQKQDSKMKNAQSANECAKWC